MQRDEWRRQVQRVKEGGTMQWCGTAKCRSGAREVSAPASSTINTRLVRASSAYESVRQYPQRHARETFFRPRTKNQTERIRNRTKGKNKSMYRQRHHWRIKNEQKRLGSIYWELYHLEWTPPTISGYCNQRQQQRFDNNLNQTLSITPPSVHSMIHYQDNT